MSDSTENTENHPTLEEIREINPKYATYLEDILELHSKQELYQKILLEFDKREKEALEELENANKTNEDSESINEDSNVPQEWESEKQCVMESTNDNVKPECVNKVCYDA